MDIYNGRDKLVYFIDVHIREVNHEFDIMYPYSNDQIETQISYIIITSNGWSLQMVEIRELIWRLKGAPTENHKK